MSDKKSTWRQQIHEKDAAALEDLNRRVKEGHDRQAHIRSVLRDNILDEIQRRLGPAVDAGLALDVVVDTLLHNSDDIAFATTYWPKLNDTPTSGTFAIEPVLVRCLDRVRTV